MKCVRRAIVFSLIAAIGSCVTATPQTVTGDAEPLCVIAPAAMPREWRPANPLPNSLSGNTWTSAEAKDAEYAARRGLEELTDYFSARPQSVLTLREDAVEPFLDASYAASNTPDLRRAALDEGRRVLTPLLEPYLRRQPESAKCDEYSSLENFAIYAHALLPAGDGGIARMVTLTKAAYRACGSLSAAMRYDYRKKLARQDLSTDDVWDLVMWSITLTDAQVVPGLDLPQEARDLPPAVWRFVARYPLAGARTYAKGALDSRFYDTAYLATHIAYIPTGYGRYPIYVADAPELYRFLRENFYAALETDDLDLVAEFVDLFRQYGCTERTDLQLRDGTRYLLSRFHASGDRWMAYRAPHETSDSEYDLVHKAWTGMSGVRVRVPEPIRDGTYGGVVRSWLGYPARPKTETH